jgi:hypothetical protein
MKLKTVKNVTLMEAGIEYKLSTGPATFTPEDLRDVVCAANEDFAVPNPRLKLGHVDPRYNGPAYDGTPAFGKAVNLRLGENSMSVLCDYVGVPEWLANIMPAAYPNRSIEGWWNVETQSGKKWRFVCSAVALLGITWPGITVLEDLPLLESYYGEEVPPDVNVEVAASSQPGGDPMTTQASANLDDIRRAFYNMYVPEHTSEGASMWWVRAVLTDPNQLVVEDDNSGQLYLLPFSSDDSAAVSFGDPSPVRVDYVPDNRDAQKAAAGYVAAALAVGREVMASWETRAASRPESTGGAMDPKQIRERLNLPEDATEEQVQQTLRELNEAAGTAAPGQEEPTAQPATTAPAAAPGVVPAQQGGTTPVSTGTPEPTTNAAIAAAGLPPGVVLIDEGAWRMTQERLARVDSLVEENAKSKRENLVSAAVADGRIPPSRKEHWLTYLEKDPGGEAALASLTRGMNAPTVEIGHGHGPETTYAAVELEEETVRSWTDQLFPDVAATRQQEAASAAGQLRRPRVASDGSYAGR